MRKQTRSSHALAIKRQTPNFDIGVNTSKDSNSNNNKRGDSAKSYSLLPLALRPRLFGAAIIGLLTVFTVQKLNLNNASAFTLTLTISENISLNLSPNTNNGFGENTTTGISIKTTSPAGYKLQLQAKDKGTNDLSNNDVKLSSIRDTISSDDFKNNGVTNTWGYKPSKLNGTENNNYKAAPSGEDIDTLDTTSAANYDAANDYELSLAAKIDNTIPAGTYSNNFILTATANSLNYTINYNLNSGSWTESSNTVTGNTTDETVVISSVTPTKDNSTFKGWCSVEVTSNDTSSPFCSGTTYQPSEPSNKLSLTSANNVFDFYAMWELEGWSYTINYYSNIGSPSNMPSTQSGSISSPYSVTLSGNTPTLSDYTFQGWCTSSNITNNGTTSTPSCTGIKYQPNDPITISSNGQTINLYAIWKKNIANGYPCSHSGWSGTAIYYAGLCWMWTDYKTNRTWNQAISDCPSGWRLPSKTEFEKLINVNGEYEYNNSSLRRDGWTAGAYYWAFTEFNNLNAYYLNIYDSKGVRLDYYSKTNPSSVRCVTN